MPEKYVSFCQLGSEYKWIKSIVVAGIKYINTDFINCDTETIVCSFSGVEVQNG